jgi:hypothetical protein
LPGGTAQTHWFYVKHVSGEQADDPDPKRYKQQIKSLELRRILMSYERLAIEGLKLSAKGLSISEICDELNTRRDALLRAFDMAKDQGWNLMAGENAGLRGGWRLR